jgi:hypothetical protein
MTAALWDSPVNKRDHILKHWRYENGSTAVSMKQQLQTLDGYHIG